MFGPIALIKDTDPADWIRTVMVDLVGAYLTCRAFVPAMIDAGWGRMINVTSAASLHPPGILNSAYGTSKAGLNQLTRHLAAELEGTGVTANVIHPGDLKTEMWADIKAQVEALGPIADPYAQWVDWVAETGGDPRREGRQARHRHRRERRQRPVPLDRRSPATSDPELGRGGRPTPLERLSTAKLDPRCAVLGSENA